MPAGGKLQLKLIKIDRVGIEIGQRQGDALIPAGRTQLACRNNYPFLFLNRIITLLLRFRSNLIRFLISRDMVFRFGLQVRASGYQYHHRRELQVLAQPHLQRHPLSRLVPKRPALM